MIAALLDALNIDQVDLVGNDSGSAVSQIFAARNASRLRSLTLTNSVVHDQWPPPALVWLVDAARRGTYKIRLKRLLGDLGQFRANLGHVFERPERLTDETLLTYYEPFVASEASGQNLERFIISIKARHTVEIEAQLRELCVPTLLRVPMSDLAFRRAGPGSAAAAMVRASPAEAPPFRPARQRNPRVPRIGVPPLVVWLANCTPDKRRFLYLLFHFYIRQVHGAIDGAPDEPLSGKRHHRAGWRTTAL
jgi:pimeloyl-ACP methyl ester carboxylesterase